MVDFAGDVMFPVGEEINKHRDWHLSLKESINETFQMDEYRERNVAEREVFFQDFNKASEMNEENPISVNSEATVAKWIRLQASGLKEATVKPINELCGHEFEQVLLDRSVNPMTEQETMARIIQVNNMKVIWLLRENIHKDSRTF